MTCELVVEDPNALTEASLNLALQTLAHKTVHQDYIFVVHPNVQTKLEIYFLNREMQWSVDCLLSS